MRHRWLWAPDQTTSCTWCEVARTALRSRFVRSPEVNGDRPIQLEDIKAGQHLAGIVRAETVIVRAVTAHGTDAVELNGREAARGV